jgi:hypothetical protein
MERIKNLFAGMKLLVVAALVCVIAVVVASCSDTDVKGEMPTLTNVVTDTVTKEKTDTVVISPDWSMNIIRVNRGDTLDITVEMEKSDEKDTIHGQAIIWAQKTGYQILESEEVLTPKYANAGMSGGRTVKENVTDAGWVDVTKFSYPTEDNNVVYVEVRIDHHKGRPVLRVTDSEIMSLEDPSMSTRSLYKVKDAPIRASDLVSFETEGFKEDTSFGEEISTSFTRDLMAEDDISGAKEVNHGFEVVDETTDRMWINERFTMKSGKTNDVERSFLRQRWQKNIDPYELYVNSFAYEFGSVLGMSSYEGEKSLERGNDNWSGKGKIDMYNANINGEKPVKTQYTFYHESWTYRDKYITVEFPYVSFIVTEAKTAVNGATSDKDMYTKAILENNINTDYADYKSSMSEIVYLYSKVERKVVDHGFKINTKKRTWETNRMTPSVVHYRLWNDGVEETTTHEWPLSRSLSDGPTFERVCKDNYNRTGNPSITSIKDSDKEYTDENGGKWTCVEQNGTIGASVEFNGADGASVTWKFTEHNKVRLEVDGDVIEWGEDLYKYTLKPSLGEGSEKSGYMVYPYTAKLNYVFGDAPAKDGTDTGVIKVKKEKQVKKEYFEDKQKLFTATTETYKAKHVTEFDDNTKDEVSFEWVRERNLTSGPVFERTAKDNTNRTGKPSILDLKSSKKTYTDKSGGSWSGNEEKSTIGATVSFNGTEDADVLFYATETNDVQLKYKDAICDFGHDEYSYTLSPALATGTVKDGFTVYPYTATLNYVFGTAAAKQATDKGSIKVAVPEEDKFIPEKYGYVDFAVQSTTHRKDKQGPAWVVSVHTYNEKTGKRYVFPILFEEANPTTPLWGCAATPDWSTVEECSQALYEAYNSAYWFNSLGKWQNAIAEDARQWLQWSRYEANGNKKGHGSELYDTAKSKNWDYKSFIDGRATVYTHRYKIEVIDHKLYLTDTYTGKKVTDKYATDGGWR